MRLGFVSAAWHFIAGPLIALAIASAADAAKPVLSIYVYDSLAASGGLGHEIFPIFEKRCGCELKVLPSGDGSQLLNRLRIDSERGKHGAQLVMGLDQPTFERSRPYLEDEKGWTPRGTAELVPEVRRELKRLPGFVPFDYGFFAFMADRQALAKLNRAIPEKLSDVLDPAWRRSLLLEDPRTSTPGLAFILYVQEVAGGGARVSALQDFWVKMRTQWLTLPPSWDSAYGLFLRGEAPLVWSYTTSQAYHEARGDFSGEKRRYESILFKEGQPMQIEGAAMVKGAFAAGEEGAAQKRLAREFLEFLISPEVQNRVGARQWMYPSRKNAQVPTSFSRVPRPARVISLRMSSDEVKSALSNWTKAIEQAN